MLHNFSVLPHESWMWLPLDHRAFEPSDHALGLLYRRISSLKLFVTITVARAEPATNSEYQMRESQMFLSLRQRQI
jgi:hypothetical protein